MHIRPRWLTLVVVLALALSAAACGSSSGGGSGNASCQGSPIKILTNTDLDTGASTYNPAPLYGAQAAAKAINATCGLGRPIEIVQCNSHSTAQGSTTCGQTAVSEKVLAVAGGLAFSDNYISVIAKQNIPALPALGEFAQEFSYQHSFPIDSGMTQLTAYAVAAANLGAKKVVLLNFQGPTASFFDSILDRAESSLGLEKLPDVLFPPTATDMTAYATQAVSSGADAIQVIANPPQVVNFVKQLRSQGVDFTKTKVIVSGLDAQPSVIEQLGPQADGLYQVLGTASPDDTANPGIQQYLSDLKANGTTINGVNASELGVAGWTAIKIIADAMKGATTFTPEELIKRLNSLPADFHTAYPAVPPFNFSTNAFPDNPMLSKMRIFSNLVSIGRIQDTKFVPLTKGYIRADQKTALN